MTGKPKTVAVDQLVRVVADEKVPPGFAYMSGAIDDKGRPYLVVVKNIGK